MIENSVVFAPKYRRLAIYGKYKKEIGKILRTICERKGIVIIEAELCPDHIHMLVEIPPKYSVSGFMGELKGKSSLMIFDQFGKNTKMIQEYIQNQLAEDKLADQMSMKEFIDLFTGEKVVKEGK